MKGKRRNPFDRLKGVEGEPAAYIPPPASKTKRDREWDREHNVVVVTYRGIPQELREAVKRIADEYGVPVGEVARLLLEHGLQAYQDGQIKLQPRPASGKLTLFPK